MSRNYDGRATQVLTVDQTVPSLAAFYTNKKIKKRKREKKKIESFFVKECLVWKK